jgi:predicted 3-demethylubiquinone-9 3-methyltransferase (glyoxalase superfamily)
LKDQFGLSWQVVPIALGDMLADPDPEKTQRVTDAFLKMKKLDLVALERVYAGE